MRTCCRCGKQMPFATVTVMLATEYDHWSGWFCRKECAKEYLEQEIIADQQETTEKITEATEVTRG